MKRWSPLFGQQVGPMCLIPLDLWPRRRQSFRLVAVRENTNAAEEPSHHGGGLPQVTVDSFVTSFQRTGAPCLFARITVVRFVSRILSEAQRRVAGWSYFQFRRVHQRRKRRCTMKKPPLCRSPTMEVSRICSHKNVLFSREGQICESKVTSSVVWGVSDEEQVGQQQYLETLCSSVNTLPTQLLSFSRLLVKLTWK